MKTVIENIFRFGPLLFAFGFLVPLIKASVEALQLSPPFGLSTLMFSLIIGGCYGLVAQVRGRWV